MYFLKAIRTMDTCNLRSDFFVTTFSRLHFTCFKFCPWTPKPHILDVRAVSKETHQIATWSLVEVESNCNVEEHICKISQLHIRIARPFFDAMPPWPARRCCHHRPHEHQLGSKAACCHGRWQKQVVNRDKVTVHTQYTNKLPQ